MYLCPGPRAAGTPLRDSHTETRRTTRRTGLAQVERVGSTVHTLSAFNIRLLTVQQLLSVTVSPQFDYKLF